MSGSQQGGGAPATGGETPRPMPFAIMRNSHEALRASIRLQEARLAEGDRNGFRDEWSRFQRALAVHMAMEDDHMFGLLDETGGGAISAAGLPAEHGEDRRLAAIVTAALEQGADAVALQPAWSAWRDDHLHHLSHEEQVMMPLTMKTAPTPEGRARLVHERLLNPAERGADFDWYVGWVVQMLGRYGSAEQAPNVATRVFAWGLQNACSPAQWNRLKPVVRSNCPPAIWDEMAQKFGLDGDGPIH